MKVLYRFIYFIEIDPLFFLRSLFLIVLFHFLTSTGCKKDASIGQPQVSRQKTNTVDVWVTTGDKIKLLQKEKPIRFDTIMEGNLVIDIDPAKRYQTIDGFGYTLTGGSAVLINKLSPQKRKLLLRELFSNDQNAISVSYLRISIGASDLDSVVFSYNDLPTGQTDADLKKFSLRPDKENLIPLLKDILAIAPALKIMASPWSAPAWMKDNNSTKGGSLKPEFYAAFADYFVKYIQLMKAEGISIDAITPQNEPLHPGNNPSMLMPATQQTNFIKHHLGPKFQQAGIKTKIIIYDHNADRPDYPLTILNDSAAKAYVDGSAFHLYAGDISALSQVHNAHPDKKIYFTEQWTGAKGTFSGDLKWHVRHVIVGSMRNWSRNVMEWNLANDPTYGPHTPGGCTECKGALTIGNNIRRNVSYYIIAHAAKFVPPGSVRISSNLAGDIYNVAFKTPDNRFVLIAVNDGNTPINFNIRFNGKWALATLQAAAVATYVWQ